MPREWLYTLVCFFSSHYKANFIVELVEVILAEGKSAVYPKLSYRTVTIDSKASNTCVGIDESLETIAKYFTSLIELKSIKFYGRFC